MTQKSAYKEERLKYDRKAVVGLHGGSSEDTSTQNPWM